MGTDTHFIVMPRSLSSSRENFIQHVFTICQDPSDFNDNFDFIGSKTVISDSFVLPQQYSDILVSPLGQCNIVLKLKCQLHLHCG